MIKAVIYDLDDLMVNSYKLHDEAWDILLKRYGHSYDELSKSEDSNWIGMRVIDICRDILKQLEIDVPLDTFYRERLDIFMDLVKDKLQLMPGLRESLAMLKKNSFRLAIASSGANEYIQIVLAKFRIYDYFEVIVTGDDVKLGKPNPETYSVACDKLGLKPSECLVLEDAKNGIEAAKAAGCKCIGVENPYEPQQDRSKADLIIKSLEYLTVDKIRGI